MIAYDPYWLDEDAEELPKTTLQGLRSAIDNAPGRPDPMSWSEYLAAPASQQLDYDRARRLYVKRTLRVQTPEQREAHSVLQRTITANRNVPNSRRAVMVTSPSFFGKTDLALMQARSVERGYATRFPDYRELGHAPVAWCEVTPNTTGKSLLRGLIEFYAPGAPLPRSLSTDEMLSIAGRVTRAHHTRLIVIDEANHLGGREPAGFIKLIQNQLSSTLLLTGVDLLGGRAFGTVEGRQVTSRSIVIPLKKVDLETDSGSELWTTWVAAFDKHLPLCDHQPGVLVDNLRVLHRATGGQLGYLALIVTQLVDNILYDFDRSDERISTDRLWAVIDEVQCTRLASGSMGRKRLVAPEDLVTPSARQDHAA